MIQLKKFSESILSIKSYIDSKIIERANLILKASS
jgi:hypothetical protein